MKKDYCALSFSEKERICEEVFISNGPYWHVYTDGTKMQNIFCSYEDFDTGMWLLAASCFLCEEARIITFELMHNHFHMIMSGKREACLNLFETFAGKIKRTFARMGRIVDWERLQVDILPVESLQTLRNEIIYTNRNAFVADPSHTPDSYPWGGGCAYFNRWLKELHPVSVTSMKVEQQRALLHSRDTSQYTGLMSVNGTAYIPSFCDISLGESLFRDPRSYFNSLTRNAEAFSQIAARLKDTIFLTDDELFSATVTHISKEYGIRQPSTLSPQQKIDTARHLHFKLNASNQQIRRILRLELRVLEEMFP